MEQYQAGPMRPRVARSRVPGICRSYCGNNISFPVRTLRRVAMVERRSAYACRHLRPQGFFCALDDLRGASSRFLPCRLGNHESDDYDWLVRYFALPFAGD